MCTVEWDKGRVVVQWSGTNYEYPGPRWVPKLVQNKVSKNSIKNFNNFKNFKNLFNLSRIKTKKGKKKNSEK